VSLKIHFEERRSTVAGTLKKDAPIWIPNEDLGPVPEWIPLMKHEDERRRALVAAGYTFPGWEDYKEATDEQS
jgi:hypothetical protein